MSLECPCRGTDIAHRDPSNHRVVRGTAIPPPSPLHPLPPWARDTARRDWRAHPEAADGPAGTVRSRERPEPEARSVTGRPPAAARADGPAPEARSVTGRPPAA